MVNRIEGPSLLTWETALNLFYDAFPSLVVPFLHVDLQLSLPSLKSRRDSNWRGENVKEET